MRLSPFLSIALWVFASAISASGQVIVPIAQDRQLDASLNVYDPNTGSTTQSAQAPDLEPWLFDIEAQLAPPSYSYDISGFAVQYSELGDALSAYGAADVAAADGDWYVYGDANTSNRFKVRFAVPAQVSYNLVGAIAVQAARVTQPGDPNDPNDPYHNCCEWYVDSSVSVHLRQIAGSTVYDQQILVHGERFDVPPVVSGSSAIASAGVLAPGIYELEVVAAVAAPYFSLEYDTQIYGEATYTVTMSFTPIDPDPSCDAADLDQDGDVDMVDWSLMQQCFSGPGL